MADIIDFLKTYTDGKQNTEKVEISVLQLNRVIKALEQEPKILNTLDFAIDASNGDTNYFVGFRNGMRYAKSLVDGEEPQFESCAEQEPILDKIRAEILEEKECAYADFERYKVEYLGQDWEDACDSLPQDDFRYGMERCIDIIDKYKAESEDKE